MPELNAKTGWVVTRDNKEILTTMIYKTASVYIDECKSRDAEKGETHDYNITIQ